MCLSVPARITSIKGEMATASIGGTVVDIGLQLVEDVKVNDYVLVHTGYAIQKISEEDAQETLKLIKELEDIEDTLDKENNSS